jgi:CheY-like chemotaxis protein
MAFTAVSNAPDGPPVRGWRPTVLVVEDMLEMREILATVLEHADFDVITAADGAEAIAAAERVHPNVILMDIAMPIMDGIKATKVLKASAGNCDTPVVAYCCDPASVDRESALFARIMPKSSNPRVLIDELHDLALKHP